MRGKSTFTKEEAVIIRRILADPNRDLRERNVLRGLGFYIQDLGFTGMTDKDFDRLVRSGRITVEGE
jgi:hypothetical protein